MARGVTDLMDALDAAYDDFAKCRDKFANAKADYEQVRLTAIAKSSEKSAAAKAAEAEHMALDQKLALIRAEAMSEITQTHVRVLLGELVAAQSQQKYAGKIDGGTDWGDY